MKKRINIKKLLFLFLVIIGVAFAFSFKFTTKASGDFIAKINITSIDQASNGLQGDYNIKDSDGQTYAFNDLISLINSGQFSFVFDGEGGFTDVYVYNNKIFLDNLDDQLTIEFNQFNRFVSNFNMATSQGLSYVTFKDPLDTLSPVFSGEVAYLTNIDSPVTETQIRAGISAYDNVDGDVTHKIQLVSDGYTANKSTLGTYQIKYSVADDAGNIANLTVKVTVVDVTAPYLFDVENGAIANQLITGEFDDSHQYFGESFADLYTTARALFSDINHLTDDELSIIMMLNLSFGVSFGFKDNTHVNYNGDNIFFTSEWEGNLFFEVIKNPFENETTFTHKNYEGKFKVGDKYGNFSDVYTVQVNYIDTIAPTISGLNAYSTTPETKLNVETIKSNLQAHDNKDGNVTSSIVVKTDNYSANYNIIGTYTIVFEAQDSSGNKGTFNLSVTVTDNVPPVFYVSDVFITIDESLNWTQEQIINHLSGNGQLPQNIMSFYSITQSNYMSAPGEYLITLTKNEDAPADFQDEYVIGVLVNESQEEPPIVEDEPPIDDDEPPIVDTEETFGDKFKAYWEENGVKFVSIGLIIIAVLIVGALLGYGGKRRRR